MRHRRPPFALEDPKWRPSGEARRSESQTGERAKSFGDDEHRWATFATLLLYTRDS